MTVVTFQEWILDQPHLLRDGRVMTRRQAQAAGHRIERAVRLPHTELWIEVPARVRLVPPAEVINDDALMALLWQQSRQAGDTRAAVAEAERLMTGGDR